MEDEVGRKGKQLETERSAASTAEAAAVLEAQRQQIAARKAQGAATHPSREASSATPGREHMTTVQLRHRLRELGVAVPEGATREVLRDLVGKHTPESEAKKSA